MSAALVDGDVVPGDVDIDPSTGRIVSVGHEDGGGRGLAVPGLVDLQVNGFAGIEFRSCDPDGYAAAARALAARGVTAVQPTYFSQSIEDYEASLRTLGEVHTRPPEGCRFLPAHLEGPFMAPAWHGAHQVEFFLAPDTTVADRLLAAGPLGFMTVAPELPGGLDLVRHLTARGVVVSIGHSDATADETRAAVAAGARHLTHCWNAHRRLTSRDPGPGGVALSEPGLVVGLIADLVHVAEENVRLTMHAAAGRVAVTTDAIPFAGAGAAEWLEHGRIVSVVGGAAQLADGTIAGGIAGPDDCLRNLVHIGIELAAAVDACGGVQRRLLGLPEVRMRPGDPADVVVLDEDQRALRTVLGGHEIWAA